MNNHRNYINGKRLASALSEMAQNINPANVKDIIGAVKLSTRSEARTAVEAAWKLSQKSEAKF
jgi:acyl-CoA reductase-like NAD-dependent aldehyde dehydrogenase